MTHPIYLGWQIDWPLFVKAPFSEHGRGELFDWVRLGLEPQRVSQLYNAGFLYHNKDLEIQYKVGDRLDEMDIEKMTSLVRLMNDVVKKKAVTAQEYNRVKCTQSKIETKQRAFIRSFLRNNPWIQEQFESFRDHLLE